MKTFEVELIKDRQGLGITIAGYVCEKGMHFKLFFEHLIYSCFTLLQKKFLEFLLKVLQKTVQQTSAKRLQ